MPRLSLLLVVLAGTTLTSSVGGAQLPQVRLPSSPPIRQLNAPPKSPGDTQPIPVAYRPPPGMCRIWLEGVPPAQQPAPTDCTTAVRNRPSNGKVLFGDDYVERRGKDRDRKPDDRTALGGGPVADHVVAVAIGPRVHGPNVEDAAAEDAPAESLIDAAATDARLLDEPGVAAYVQPPTTARRRGADAARRPARPDTVRDRAPADREPADRGDRAPARGTLSDERAARRDSVRAAREGRSPAGRTPAGRDANDRAGDARYDDREYDARGYDARRYDDRGNGYGDSRYVPPGRANGVCLDRDGDGWCDDARTGGGFCRDLDGDGRCDDYPALAAAPYASALPPMQAATDVRRGVGSSAALRWLGTAEVTVRTVDTKRTGTPYRAMWLDASSGRLLQVWTDRNGDGIADRVDVYRNGRIAKTIGR